MKTLTLTEKMAARLDESCGQMVATIGRLVAEYGEDDESVRRLAKALARRQVLSSYLDDRAAR